MADQGDAAAQRNLGLMYAAGLGVAQDYAEAIRWYRKAAEQGYAGAQSDLGFRYAHGQGVPQDYAEAVGWYRKAADQGDAGGQANLGFMYEKGLGVPQDHSEAVKWFRMAADQGDAAAQQNLGFMYANGKGVAWNLALGPVLADGSDCGSSTKNTRTLDFIGYGHSRPHRDQRAHSERIKARERQHVELRKVRKAGSVQTKSRQRSDEDKR